MGEFSDYFEDFPEENPAHWMTKPQDPVAALSRIRQTGVSGEGREAYGDKIRAEIRKVQAAAMAGNHGTDQKGCSNVEGPAQ